MVVERQLQPRRARRGRTSGARRSSQRAWEWKERVGRHHHPAAPAPGRLAATGRASASRWTPGSRARCARCSSGSDEEGLIYRGRLHRQLVPALPDRARRPRGRARGARRRVRLHQVRPADARAPCARRRSSATPALAVHPERSRATRSTWASTLRDPVGRWGDRHHGRRRRGGRPGVRRRASSRSRPATTRSTSRSGGATACRVRHGDRLRRPDDGAGGRSTPGWTASSARRRIVEDMQALGLIERIEPYRHAVGVCYRCKTVVEPLVSKQWYVEREAAGRARRSRPCARTRSAIAAAQLEQDVLPLDGEHPRLVHLPPALVGPPHSRPGTATPTARSRRRAPIRRACPSCARPVAPGRRRPRHLVLARALAVLDAGLAGGHAGPRALLPDRPCWSPATTSSSSGSRG